MGMYFDRKGIVYLTLADLGVFVQSVIIFFLLP